MATLPARGAPWKRMAKPGTIAVMRHPGFAILALFSATLALLAAPAGCTNRTITSICHQFCDCAPCTKHDLDACVTKGETAETSAQKKNCSNHFNALLTCIDENLSCQPGFGVGTDKCTKEEEGLRTCGGLEDPFVTPCAQAALRVSGCNGNGNPTQTPCPPILACSALCTLAQPCDVLNGMTFSQPFQDCQNQCTNPQPTGVGGGFSGAVVGVGVGGAGGGGF